MSMRLDAFLTQGVGLTRKEARKVIRAGRVYVAGERARSQATHIERDSEVRFDGELVELPPSALTVIMHKPVGYACSHDPDEAPVIDELLPSLWRRARVEPAGRLDRATSGLLICSTDGQLIHRLIHPKRKVAKRYRVHFQGELAKRAEERVAAGLCLPDDDKPLLPAQLIRDGEQRATVILHEGRYHQVRRMIAALGGHVVGLHRDAIGALDLPTDLAPGDVRELREDERTRLFV